MVMNNLLPAESILHQKYKKMKMTATNTMR